MAVDMVGVGLTVLGIGAPTAVALMRLLPAKNGRISMVECPIREHEARMGQIEKDVAVLEAERAMINACLTRIEHKLDMFNGHK